MKYQYGNYKVTFTSENSIEIDDIKNNKTIFIDNSTDEQIVSVEGDHVHKCKQGTNDRII
mgnify:CR=1 FL=1|jgi:hypothetical protein